MGMGEGKRGKERGRELPDQCQTASYASDLYNMYWGWGSNLISKLNFISKILNFNCKSVPTKKAQKINTEVNERPLKNIGTHWNVGTVSTGTDFLQPSL